MLNKCDRLTNLMRAFKAKHRRASLIIGAHSGLGFDLALHLAQQQQPIIIASHCEEKITETKAILQFRSGFDDIYPIHIDYSDLSSVQSFIDTAIDLDIKIELLVNAVDFANSEREITKDGFEKTISVNHFGPYLLVDQLKDQFINDVTRVIFFSSFAHRHGHIDHQRLASQMQFDTFSAYCNAKLANAVAITYFAEQLKARGITVNGFAPSTPQMTHWPISFKMIDLMQVYFRRYLVDKRESLDSLLSLCSNGQDSDKTNLNQAKHTGQLFINHKKCRFASIAYKSSVQQLIAEVSRKVTHFNAQEWTANQVLSTKTLSNESTDLNGQISYSTF